MSTRRAGGHYDATMQLYVDGELFAPRGGEDLHLQSSAPLRRRGVREDPPLQPTYPPGRLAPVRCALLCPECSHLSLRSVAPPAERAGSMGWSGSSGAKERCQELGTASHLHRT